MMKISIVVPVYNTSKYLRKCLDSIINQTYKNIEIICVNDGSSDNSLDILYEYKNKDKRISIINQENQGLVCVRMNALKCCHGKYVLFVDSDDWIDLKCVEILADYLCENNDVDIIKFRYIMEPSKKEQDKYFNSNKLYSGDDLNEIYKELLISSKYNNLANQLTKKELFSNVSYEELIKINQGEDKYINIDLFLNSKKILFINDILYNYYNNENSISHNTNKEKFILKFYSLGLIYTKINKILISKFGKEFDFINKVKTQELKNLTIYLKRFLSISTCNKNDLAEVQKILEKTNIYDYISDNNFSLCSKNLIERVIGNNILKKKIIKCYIFKPFFLMRKKIIEVFQ